MGWRNLQTVKAERSGLLELGRLTLPKPYREPTLEERVATAFDQNRSIQERFERAVRDSQLNYLQTLLFVADPKSDVAKEFIALRYNYDGSLSAMHDAIAEHRLVAVDPQQAAALLQKLSVAPPRQGEATLAIVGDDGTVVDQSPLTKLTKFGRIDAKLLTSFLTEHRIVLPNAREKLQDALRQAGEQDKRVLVQVSGPGCGWCVILARYLNEQKLLMNKDYVWLKLDSRMEEASEVIGELRKKQEGGIPWMCILDAHGDILVTSDDAKIGNIGYPGEADTRPHWQKMLRETRQRLTDDDIAALMKPLEVDPLK
jgi:hypothetical protein